MQKSRKLLDRLSKYDKISCSFSGGRTSAVMTKLVLDTCRDTHEIVVTFANTGCEHEDTLRFVDACDKHWGFNTVWIEPKISPEHGIGIRYRLVDYISASRDGRPFEDVVRKYGVPNQGNPLCTRFIKTDAMESYLKSIGFLRGKKLNYYTAIGIRADEMDRIAKNYEQNAFIYPLLIEGWTKKDVLDFMEQQPWDLKIPEILGNCTWCWKKSKRKLYTLAKTYPDMFNFPAFLEGKYGWHKANNSKREDGRRTFFRGHKSANEIVAESKLVDFDMWEPDKLANFDPSLDLSDGCVESCEVYPTNGEEYIEDEE